MPREAQWHRAVRCKSSCREARHCGLSASIPCRVQPFIENYQQQINKKAKKP
jgi:hypothetical protein